MMSRQPLSFSRCRWPIFAAFAAELSAPAVFFHMLLRYAAAAAAFAITPASDIDTLRWRQRR